MSSEHKRVRRDSIASEEVAELENLRRKLELLQRDMDSVRRRLASLSGANERHNREEASLQARLDAIEIIARGAMYRANLVYESRTWKALARCGRAFRNAVALIQGKPPQAVEPDASDLIVIHCDFPPADGKALIAGRAQVYGWAAAETGIERFEIRVGGKVIRTRYGGWRPDVKRDLPAFQGSEKSGFHAVVNGSDFADGPNQLQLIALSKSGGTAEIKRRIVIDNRTNYEVWREQHPVDSTAIAAMKREAGTFGYQPLVTIVCPVFNTPEVFLNECVQAVRTQIYPNWELILVDDGSSAAHIRTALERFAKEDERIFAYFLPANRGIAAATNEAIAHARGAFVGFLDHDDELAPHALHEVVRELNEDDEWDVFYSDEDKVSPDGRHFDPFFKPGWSPDLIMARNYACHFLVCRTTLLRSAGGLKAGYEGSQDHDLVLRLSERTQRIRRIPKILYHWRAWAGSTANGVAQKPEASNSGLRAVNDHLARTAPGATAIELSSSAYRVRYPLRGTPEVAIIIPTGGNSLLEQAIQSVLDLTTYPNYRIVVVDNSKEGVSARLERFSGSGHPISLVDCRGLPFNFSSLCNRAAKTCNADYLLFLNDDTRVISHDWIEAMLEHAQRPEVGAVGALLLFPDERIQHAGVVMGVYGLAAHSFRFLDVEEDYYFLLPLLTRNCAAVTGACLLVARDRFWEVGGFDEENLPTAFQDVDFCLKLDEKGYRMIYTPYARLYHYESATKTAIALESEIDYMHQRWEAYIDNDPYYNPNLTRKQEDYSLPR